MDELLKFVETLDIELPEGWAGRIEMLHELIVDANKRCNLTRIIDFRDYLFKHVADSLLAVKALPELAYDPMRVLDLGCGPGIPGLILALTFPKLLCSEVDARRKKVDAVSGFIRDLDLENAEAVHANGFELSHTAEYKGQIDVVIARAVGTTDKIIHQTRRFLVPKDGLVLAYKTPQQIDEERELVAREACKRAHKLKAETSDEFELPYGYGRRQFWLLTQSGRVKP